MGTLVKGQFIAVQQVAVQYVPALATHDGVFSDISSQAMSLAVTFTAKDVMIAGESFSFSLYGLTSASAPIVSLFPQDRVNICNLGLGTLCKSAGVPAFTGVQGTAQAGTTNSITLGALGSCGADQACTGSTIVFTSGSGSGQTAIIVNYVQATLVATITYVAVPADATTTYSVSSAPVSKFSASWSTGTPGTLTLTVISSTGTASLCTPTLCTATSILLGAGEKAAAGYYDGHAIEFVGGTGKGQVATCLKYYGAPSNHRCDITPVAVPADSTTTYRVGPIVMPGEQISVVIPSSVGLVYPHFSGVATAGSTSTLTLSALASTIPNFYVGMDVEVEMIPGAVSIASAITDLETSTVLLSALPSLSRIAVGSYIKVDNEVMLVEALNGNTATVFRAQLGTAASTHSVGAIPAVYAYGVVTNYNQALRQVTVTPLLPFAVTANDIYRIGGANTMFSFTGTVNTFFSTSPVPYSGSISTVEYQTSTLQLMIEFSLTNNFYVGATLRITNGPGQGLFGVISSYTVGTGVAAVSLNLASCGGPSPCGPKGSSDNGYLVIGLSPTSARVLSQYEIFVLGTVASYSAQTLTLNQQLAFTIPAIYDACTTYDDAVLKRVCLSLTPNVPTPVKLEWVAGSWCAESGGTGWGATSPCVAHDLIVTTSSNKFVYGLSPDGTVKFKFKTGKRIKAPPRYCPCHFNPKDDIYYQNSMQRLS